jgi:hypothetical protein
MLFNHGVLKSVKLSNANLTGPIPSMANQTSLWELDLQGNALTGSLPAVLPTTLQRVLLGRNELTGTLPAYTGASALQFFDASFNNLSGGLRPEWAGSMPGLRDLFLQGNNLTGSLPPEVTLIQWFGHIAYKVEALIQLDYWACNAWRLVALMVGVLGSLQHHEHGHSLHNRTELVCC